MEANRAYSSLTHRQHYGETALVAHSFQGSTTEYTDDDKERRSAQRSTGCSTTLGGGASFAADEQGTGCRTVLGDGAPANDTDTKSTDGAATDDGTKEIIPQASEEALQHFV